MTATITSTMLHDLRLGDTWDGLTVLTVLPEMDGTVTVTGRDGLGRVWRIRTADREVTV